MTKVLKSRVKKFGLPPGSLVITNENNVDQAVLSVVDFNKDQVIENKNATIEECLIFLDNPTITWINIKGINDPKMMETLGKHFDLHPLMQEDILNTGQRCKLDDYKSTLFIVMRIFYYNSGKQILEDEQISLVLGSNYVLSFLEGKHDIFNSIRERINAEGSRLRNSGADYLCYALIDCIVDHHFLILETLELEIDKIDIEVFNRPNNKTLQKIQKAKKEIINLKKGVWPAREVISQLRRMDSPLISDNTKLFLHDVYDHTIQAIDTIESFRDILAGMLEVYLSNISLRMNEIMKVLTMVSTTFVPMTFIASIYGMNFDYMPELHTKYGYFVALGLMLTILCSMLVYFRSKRWI